MNKTKIPNEKPELNTQRFTIDILQICISNSFIKSQSKDAKSVTFTSNHSMCSALSSDLNTSSLVIYELHYYRTMLLPEYIDD